MGATKIIRNRNIGSSSFPGIWWTTFYGSITRMWLCQLPRSVRLRPRYESASVHPMPNTGLRGVCKRGDFAAEDPDNDDNDDNDVPDDKLVSGPPPFRVILLLPMMPLCELTDGDASSLPLRWKILRCFDDNWIDISEADCWRVYSCFRCLISLFACECVCVCVCIGGLV